MTKKEKGGEFHAVVEIAHDDGQGLVRVRPVALAEDLQGLGRGVQGGFAGALI